MTSSPTPHLRRAVRAVILDPGNRVFLVRFSFPDRELWATPGGGIEPAESEHEALRRELAEEVGAIDVCGAPAVWTRTHTFGMGEYEGQRETYYLVRVDHQPLRPTLSKAQLWAEGVTASAWWTPTELAAATGPFAPRRLPTLVAELVRHGPPASPVDVGVCGLGWPAVVRHARAGHWGARRLSVRRAAGQPRYRTGGRQAGLAASNDDHSRGGHE